LRERRFSPGSRFGNKKSANPANLELFGQISLICGAESV
jgi:hypothetical protein